MDSSLLNPPSHHSSFSFFARIDLFVFIDDSLCHSKSIMCVNAVHLVIFRLRLKHFWAEVMQTRKTNLKLLFTQPILAVFDYFIRNMKFCFCFLDGLLSRQRLNGDVDRHLISSTY